MGERPFVPDFEKEQEVVRLQQLLEDIKNGSFARVYLLYGEETYLRLQYRDKLKKALIPDGDTMNYHYFEGKGVETAQLIDLAETLPFFAERRVIVVENSGLFKKATEDLAEYFKAPAPSVCFVFVETEVDKRGRLYKAVRDTGRVVEFARQNEATLQKWILIQLKKEGKRITQNDLQFFQQRVGSDMENISRELEKLFCYTMGRDVITAADIEAVCTRQIGNQIFDMVEAIAMRRQKQALDLYYDLLTLKEPPMRILFLIARQFNLLMQRSCLKNICFPMELAGVKKADAEKRARELLEVVGLPDKANAYPAQLSGGQKQRIAIARALATDPKVLLCDEATSALDPNTTHAILTLIKDINKKLGITVVVITHQMSVVEEICDHVAILDGGVVVEQGPAKEIFTAPREERTRAFLRLVEDK